MTSARGTQQCDSGKEQRYLNLLGTERPSSARLTLLSGVDLIRFDRHTELVYVNYGMQTIAFSPGMGLKRRATNNGNEDLEFHVISISK